MPTLGIMQPYFLPYIGYFQLMNAVDEFVVYDRIEYSKGWINRNRILVNGQDAFISLPLKRDSDYLTIEERNLADSWPADRKKMINRITESYRKAPEFQTAFPVMEACLAHPDTNLFRFLLHSLSLIRDFLGIQTPLVASSTVAVDPSLRGEDRVIALCQARKANTYINPIGGLALYNKDHFLKQNIVLKFHKTDDFGYPQFNHPFVPFLSILDVMMFNPQPQIREFLKRYTLQ